MVKLDLIIYDTNCVVLMSSLFCRNPEKSLLLLGSYRHSQNFDLTGLTYNVTNDYVRVHKLASSRIKRTEIVVAHINNVAIDADCLAWKESLTVVKVNSRNYVIKMCS